jgi:excisionase family DNA binding protein
MTTHIAPGPLAENAPARLLLTVEEAAHRLRIGRTFMYALIQDGHVESVRIGRLRRIPIDALDNYVEAIRQSYESHSAQ